MDSVHTALYCFIFLRAAWASTRLMYIKRRETVAMGIRSSLWKLVDDICVKQHFTRGDSSRGCAFLVFDLCFCFFLQVF